MNFIKNLVHKFPKSIIITIILITGFFGYHATDISIDTDIKNMFPKDDSTVVVFDRVSERYGGSELIVLMIGDSNIIDVESLHQIDTLTKSFAGIQGVEQVRSITNIEEIRGDGITIEVGKLMSKLPQTRSQVDSFRNKIVNHERYLGTVVSSDFRYAVIITQLTPLADQQRVVSEMQRIREEQNLSAENYLTGSPVYTKEMADHMKRDLTNLLPFVTFVVMLVLFVGFRSLRGVLIPIVLVLLSVIWTIGFSAWLGQSLSIVSTALPILLVSVGSAYAIHFLARYYEDQFNGVSKENAISGSIVSVGLAIVMAGVTTAAGFSSLGVSKLSIIRDFGIFAAFGVIIALLLSIIFLPALLMYFPPAKRFHFAENRVILDYIFTGISTGVRRYSKVILSIAGLISILSIAVIPRIHPETNYITFFGRDSEVRKANALVNEKFGGSNSIEVIMNTGEINGVENPEFLKNVKNFQERLDSIPLLSNSMSIVDLLEEENKALHGGNEQYNRLPESGIAQYLLLLESDDDQIVDDFVDFDHQEVRIRVMTSSTESQKTKQILTEIRRLADKYFPTCSLTITGVPVLADKLMDLIISSQIKSLISAILFAFVITSILLKSPVKGLACSIPIALTVLVNFGIMGWTAIPLDVATSMIASVAVGIGIDYAIHLYTRYQEEMDEGALVSRALDQAIHTVGRANYFNAVAVTAGFLVLLFSSFPPLRTFGLLSSITMLVSLAGAMFLLPALIKIKEDVENKINLKINNQHN